MKGRQVITTIECETMSNDRKGYYVIIDGRKEGLSWYGRHLSPEDRAPTTTYIIAQEIDRDYGNFLGWYIDKILQPNPL